MRALALSVLLAGLACPALAPVSQFSTDGKVRDLLAHLPRTTDLVIGYHPIKGMEGQSAWHILDTHWRVKLHETTGLHGLDSFDKAKKYRVTGIVLEQDYGVVQVWVTKYRYADE